MTNLLYRTAISTLLFSLAYRRVTGLYLPNQLLKSIIYSVLATFNYQDSWSTVHTARLTHGLVRIYLNVSLAFIVQVSVVKYVGGHIDPPKVAFVEMCPGNRAWPGLSMAPKEAIHVIS